MAPPTKAPGRIRKTWRLAQGRDPISNTSIPGASGIRGVVRRYKYSSKMSQLARAAAPSAGEKSPKSRGASAVDYRSAISGVKQIRQKEASAKRRNADISPEEAVAMRAGRIEKKRAVASARTPERTQRFIAERNALIAKNAAVRAAKARGETAPERPAVRAKGESWFEKPGSEVPSLERNLADTAGQLEAAQRAEAALKEEIAARRQGKMSDPERARLLELRKQQRMLYNENRRTAAALEEARSRVETLRAEEARMAKRPSAAELQTQIRMAAGGDLAPSTDLKAATQAMRKRLADQRARLGVKETARMTAEQAAAFEAATANYRRNRNASSPGTGSGGGNPPPA